MSTQATAGPTPAVIDAQIAAAPNFADSMEGLEAALTAGVPIADLLAAQAQRLSACR